VPDTDAIITRTISTLTAQPPRTAFLVDFDGSLSQIVDRPETARPLPGVVALLEQLVARLGRVGVVSGRPLSFLREFLPVAGLSFTGLYGMQHFLGSEIVTDPRVLPYLDAVAAAVEALHAALPADIVEPKDGVSVTLHWRRCPERQEEIVGLATALAERHGLGLLPTRAAIELRPPVSIDKADAVRTIVDDYDVGAFAGDDTGDLPAFAALDELVRENALREAVKIGVASSEAPPELAGATDVLVDGPAGLVAYLGRVVDQIA
jgi:trehalose 6-phosphate phosphatase